MLPLLGLAAGAIGAQLVGGAMGALSQREAQKREKNDAVTGKIIEGLISAGQADAFDDPAIKKMAQGYFGSKEGVESAKSAATFTGLATKSKYAMAQRLLGGGDDGATAPAQAPAPAQSDELSQAGGAPGSAPATAIPSQGAFGANLRARPSITAQVAPGVSATTPGVSPLAIERFRAEQASRERTATETMAHHRRIEQEAAERTGLARERTAAVTGTAKRAAEKEAREADASKRIEALMTQSTQTTDAKGKMALFEQARAVAAGAKMDAMERELNDAMKIIKESKPPRVDLSNPHVQDFVVSNAKNPVTGEPVDDQTHREAVKAQADRHARDHEQRQWITTLATQTAEKKQAIALAVRGLQKDADDVFAFTQRVQQVEGALKQIEDHLSVYPKKVPGVVGAVISKFAQDTRGQDIKAIDQALNILQSAEARFMAGEKGRLPYQLEQQWRAALADPTKVTQDTAKTLLTATRARLADMAKAKNAAVGDRAKQAERLGVSPAVTQAFTQGDRESLGRVLPEATAMGVLPNLPAIPPGATLVPPGQ